MTRSSWTTTAALLLLLGAPSPGEAKGVDSQLDIDVTIDDTSALISEYRSGGGRRITRLSGYMRQGQPVYMFRSIPNTDGRAWQAVVGLNTTAMENYDRERRAEGMRAVDVSGFAGQNGSLFSAIYEANPAGGGWLMRLNLPEADVHAQENDLGSRGWVPRRLEGYTVSNFPLFATIWEQAPGVEWELHSRMTRSQYTDLLAGYESDGLGVQHLDSHYLNGEDFYSAIWTRDTAIAAIRSNRIERRFRRFHKNHWASGRRLDNFYVTDVPGSEPRFGGVWRTGLVPDPLDAGRIRAALLPIIEGSPSLGGVAAIDLIPSPFNDESAFIHAEDQCAVASSIKAFILYALLRRIEDGQLRLTDVINSGPSYRGTCAYPCDPGNQPSRCNTAVSCTAPTIPADVGWVQPNEDYTVRQYMEMMISVSNNRATDILIDRLGGLVLANNAINAQGFFKGTKLLRYMTGNPEGNRERNRGIENLSTPRDMAELMRRANRLSLQGEALFRADWARDLFFEFMSLDRADIPSPPPVVNDRNALPPENAGNRRNRKPYIPAALDPTAMVFSENSFFNKPGSLSGDPRSVLADIGIIQMPTGRRVAYGVCLDWLATDPDQDHEGAPQPVTLGGPVMNAIAAAFRTRYDRNAPWVGSITFPAGSTAEFKNLNYRARQDHTSSPTIPPPDAFTTWERIDTGGIWAPQVMYKVEDVASFNGQNFRALEAHQAQTNVTPPGRPSEWQPLACSLSVTQNSYDGSNWWGTIKFKNNGPTPSSNYRVEFDVPSGKHCTTEPGAIPPGAQLTPLTEDGDRTVSNRCVFSWTNAAPLAAGATKTFNYSTDTQSFSAATGVSAVDPVCRVVPSCNTLSITQNSYDGPNWWGTIKVKNDGTSSTSAYTVEFDVPSGKHCTNDYVPSGATLSPLTGSGSSARTVSNHCVFTWTNSALAAGATKTFNYSTDTQSFSAAANVSASDLACQQ